jgi:ABC-2 type transport system ATP-binding protein
MNGIEIKQLAHTYPHQSQPALRQIAFTIKQGQAFGLLGPNGAGKTTLIHILSTLLIPSIGTARICGYDIVKQSRQVRRVIGLAASSERSFYFRLTGYQNLEFFGGLLGLRGKQLTKRVEEVLESVGLTQARNVLFMRYSTGMKRKLSLARCLLHDPEVYLLDEPTSGLDPKSAYHIQQIIADLKSCNRTILLATHDMGVAESLSDTVGILREGELVAVNTPAKLRSIIKTRKMKVTFSSSTFNSDCDRIHCLLDALRSVPIVSEVRVGNPSIVLYLKEQLNVTEVIGVLSKARLEITSIQVVEPSLEDVFFWTMER